MSKAIYQEVEQKVLDNFEIRAHLSALLSNTKHAEIYSVDQDELNRVVKLISPDRDFQKLSTKRKAFVLPDVKYTVARVREYAKNVNLSIVNKVEDADIIISHNNVHKDCRYDIPNKSLAISYFGKIYSNTEQTATSLAAFKHPKAINISYTLNRWQEWRASSSVDSILLCTPLALIVAYEVEKNHIPVYDIEEIVDVQDKIDIDKELIDMLYNQCGGTDDDLKIVQKILPTIDISKKPYLAWYLVKRLNVYHHQLSKNKDVKAWMSTIDWNKLSTYNAQDFCSYLINRDKMTKEAFAELEPIMRRDIQIYNRDFYKFQVSIKDEFKKYL